jgi:imidazolonepropionase-like amidohydrolase
MSWIADHPRRPDHRRLFRMRVAAGLAAALVAVAGAAPGVDTQPADAVVFRGATIVDGTGRPPLPSATIVVTGDRITAVGPDAAVTLPHNARVIDARGRTIYPGLADLHVHLQGGWDGERADYLNFGRYLDGLLYSGVTTVLDTGNSMPFITQIKQEINAGRLRGPRVFCVGPMIDSADPIWPSLAEPLSSYGQVPRLLQRLVENHVDLVKGYAGLSDLHLTALAREARRVGLRVIVDVWERNGSASASRTGIYAFAHAPHAVDVTPELAREMAGRGMAVISTLTVRESFANTRMQDLSFLDQPLIKDVTSPNFLTEIREAAARGDFALTGPGMETYRAWLPRTNANLMTMWREGVLVAAGTDAPYPGVFQGEGLHRELELLVAAGLTPVQAIQAATGNAARFIDGAAADWGSIEAGRRADLVIVSGRPHERISDTRTIVDVMQAGRLLDRAALKVRPGEPSYRTTATLMHRTAR